MFALTSGTTNRPKTIPVTRESLQRLSRRLDDLGHPGVRRPPAHAPLRADADPPARQRLARELHPGRHPLRGDHRPDGPHAEPAGPGHLLHAAVGLEDQGRRVEVLPGPPALGLPRPRRHHRRQPEHHPGHRPARRPREGDPDPRHRRRHHRPQVVDPRRGPRGRPAPDPLEAQGDGQAARGDRRADRPAPAQGLLAEPPVPRQLDRRDDGGLSPGLSRILRRPPGPRHRPDRLRRAGSRSRSRTGRPPACSTSPATTSSSSPRTRRARTTPRPSRPPT